MKILQTQMKLCALNQFELISNISFKSAFKLICGTNIVNEEAAKWLFHFFLLGKSDATRNVCLRLSPASFSKIYRGREEFLRTHHEVANFFLKINATKDASVEINAAVVHCCSLRLCIRHLMQRSW